MVNIRRSRVVPALDERVKRRWLRQVWRGPETDCWIWIGGRTLGGYGQLRIGGDRVKFLAHRVGFVLFRGPLRAGSVVMHSCDNATCVNPEHLVCGTSKKNTWDMIGKGRWVGRGEIVAECPF